MSTFGDIDGGSATNDNIGATIEWEQESSRLQISTLFEFIADLGSEEKRSASDELLHDFMLAEIPDEEGLPTYLTSPRPQLLNRDANSDYSYVASSVSLLRGLQRERRYRRATSYRRYAHQIISDGAVLLRNAPFRPRAMSTAGLSDASTELPDIDDDDTFSLCSLSQSVSWASLNSEDSLISPPCESSESLTMLFLQQETDLSAENVVPELPTGQNTNRPKGRFNRLRQD